MGNKTAEIISDSVLFRGLPREEVGRIAQLAIGKKYKKGQTVFQEGDEGNGFYVIGDGLVKIFKMSMDGKEQILHILGPGEPIGEVPVFSGQRFPANAETIVESDLIFLPRPAFVNLISRNPFLALNMLAVLSMRLRQFATQIENLSLKEVPARLAAYLLYLAQEQGEESSVRLSISKGQLAGLLGTVPETLSRVFSKMNGQNLIEVDDRHIRFLDRDGLEELAKYGKTEG